MFGFWPIASARHFQVRHRAPKGSQSVRDFPLNERFQTKVKQFCFLLLPSVIPRLG